MSWILRLTLIAVVILALTGVLRLLVRSDVLGGDNTLCNSGPCGPAERTDAPPSEANASQPAQEAVPAEPSPPPAPPLSPHPKWVAAEEALRQGNAEKAERLYHELHQEVCNTNHDLAMQCLNRIQDLEDGGNRVSIPPGHFPNKPSEQQSQPNEPRLPLKPPAPLGWSMKIRSVAGRTVLQIRSGPEDRLRVECKQLDLDSPGGLITAQGEVKVSGLGVEGSCDRVVLNCANESISLEGGVSVKYRKDGEAVELEAEKLSLKLSDSKLVREGTKPASEAVEFKMYRVLPPGERVADIARVTLGDWEHWPEIYRLNQGWWPEFPFPANAVLRLPKNATVPADHVPTECTRCKAERPASPPSSEGSRPGVAQLPPVLSVNTKEVPIEFDVTRFGPSGVKSVDLYLTKDDGRTWQFFGEATDLGPGKASGESIHHTLRVQLPGEGVFGLCLIAKSGVGLHKPPPQPGTPPQMRVEVDLTPPEAELFKPEPEPGRRDVITFPWKAQDHHLAAKPIKLEWAERKEGPWNVIATDLPNEPSRHTWQLPASGLPALVYLRMTVHDAAGNSSEAMTPEPIPIDLHTPDIEGVKVTAPGR